jgi:hypothetical protein
VVAGKDWTEREVEAAVSAYLAMLRRELHGERPSRKATWAPLVDRLGRSKGSVEYKFGNISAALLALGLPCSDGYKPYRNRQRLIDEVLGDAVRSAPDLLEAIERFAEAPAPEILPVLPRHPARAEVPAPRDTGVEAVPAEASEPAARYLPRHVDFPALEARNRELGLLGERWVVELERSRLRALGAGELAERVEHASVVRGDGCGFDVLSFEPGGAPLHVEVKTTRSGEWTPFMVTARERAFSRDFSESYSLYRVFTFASRPRLFKLRGDLGTSCRRLVPQSWRAWA